MRSIKHFLFMMFIASLPMSCFSFAQSPAKSGGSRKNSAAPLKLLADLALPGISGDFDHLAIDKKRQRLIIAGEDHKSLEIIDLKTGKRLMSVPNMGTPHSLLYLPASDRLYVVEGEEGSVKILQGEDYKEIDKIPLAPGADSMGYDPESQTMFVVTGGKDVNLKYSILSAVDLPSKKKMGDLRFEADHVEAMAIERNGPNLFINVTDQNEVVEVDRKKMERVKSWKVRVAEQNSPATFDEADRRLFIVCRKPGMLVVLNTDTGEVVAQLPAPGHSDDVAYDPNTHRIYVPGGDGYISIYEQQDADHYKVIGRVNTFQGAKTALLVPDLERFFVAVSPGETKAKARLLMFQIMK